MPSILEDRVTKLEAEVEQLKKQMQEIRGSYGIRFESAMKRLENLSRSVDRLEFRQQNMR